MRAVRGSSQEDMEININVFFPDPNVDKLQNPEDEGDWKEITFTVPLTLEPADYSVGIMSDSWYVNGEITDDDGFTFSEDEINEMYDDSQGNEGDERKGFDWDSLGTDAAETSSDRYWDARIEAHEDAVEVSHGY
jgi:hypothetical protein